MLEEETDSDALSFDSEEKAILAEDKEMSAEGTGPSLAQAIILTGESIVTAKSVEMASLVDTTTGLVTIDGITCQLEDVQDMLDNQDEVARFFAEQGWAVGAATPDTWAPDPASTEPKSRHGAPIIVKSKMRTEELFKGTYKEACLSVGCTTGNFSRNYRGSSSSNKGNEDSLGVLPG